MILGAPIDVRPAASGDAARAAQLLTSTALFSQDEIDAASRQLAQSAAGSEPRDYYAFVTGAAVALDGFLSIGPTPRLERVFDLYWIAVAPEVQRRGIGTALLRFAEDWTRRRGGEILLIETWAGGAFQATRRFYELCGYSEESRVKDFRRLQRDRIIYSRTLT